MISRLLFSLALIVSVVTVEAKARYEKPASLSEERWLDAQPYLLPADHPVKAKLDKLFQKARVTADAKSLKAAGFTTRKPGRWSKTVSSKNKHVKGYYLKFCTDEQKMDEYPILKKRVVASISVQEAIDRHGFQKMLKVPKKWLYPIPENPPSKHTTHRKHFILVAEDCYILSHKDNESYWKHFDNKEQLTALFTIIQEEGLMDSVYPFNIPFNGLGQICFIDLEFHRDWPIPFNKLSPYLSSKMDSHWRNLRKSP